MNCHSSPTGSASVCPLGGDRQDTPVPNRARHGPFRAGSIGGLGVCRRLLVNEDFSTRALGRLVAFDTTCTRSNLALIDFITRDGVDQRWDQRLYKWWFAMDGVYFNRAHADWLRSREDMEEVWYSEEESRVPYTPYYPTHYLYVGEKKA